MSRKVTTAIWMGALCLPAAAQAGDWPQFRGTNGAGVSPEKGLADEWGPDKNVAWKVEVPGVGWASPVVWGDKIFVTTAVTDKQPRPKPFGGGPGGGPPGGGPGGGFPGRGGGKPPDIEYRWRVLCLDRANGKVLWDEIAVAKKPAIASFPSNGYATETPVTDGERLYVYFGMTGLFCFDFDGKQLWKQDLGAFKMGMSYGTGGSPTLDGDRLFVLCDNDEKSFLAAFDKKTGEELWRADRDEKSSWSTPFVWKNKKRTEIVVCGAGRVRSYDPANGKQLWELKQGAVGPMGAPASASPVGDDERVYVGSGGLMGGGPLTAVQAGASGDVTLKDDETSNDGVAWSRAGAGPNLASPLLYDGYLYILERSGLSCYEAETGKPAYRRSRLSGARGFTSSPWAADGKVYCLDENGTTFVVKAGPEFKLLATNKLDEMCWATPALAGGAILLRGGDHLFCIKP
jgi:outer membrane protein assembly factor BamB